MARINEDHTILPATHTFIYKGNELYLPLLPSRITALWRVLISRPAEGRVACDVGVLWLNRYMALNELGLNVVAPETRVHGQEKQTC